MSRLEKLEENIISTKAGLVVLDSVASVVRKEFDTTLPGNLTHRSNLLGQQAATLKYLAHEFHIPVSSNVCGLEQKLGSEPFENGVNLNQ